MTAASEITVTYRSIDRARITRKFKTVEAARRFAAEYVGPAPDMACGYAVSDDGIGKITVVGTTLAALFDAAPKARFSDADFDDCDDFEEPPSNRRPGCTCCDYGLYQVGCECGAEA